MRRRYILLAFIISITVLIITSPYECFLDRLNHNIRESSTFQPFYAGVDGLPSTTELIPELKELEDSWMDIRREMEKITSDDIPTMHDTYNNIFMYKGSGVTDNSIENTINRKIAHYIYGTDVDIFDKIGSDKWRTYNLILFNRDVPINTKRCPITTKLLKNIPGMQSALFSFMKPGAYVPPHNDPAKGVMRYHLALKVPKQREKCFINVDGKNYHWEEGKGIIFDDVYDHWVKNDTNETRVILFVDILRPLDGMAKNLQRVANFANYMNPGVTRLIEQSELYQRTTS
jgi:aspartyl/asparaginyl beta-hydroxylase (cupin superfamily)